VERKGNAAAAAAADANTAVVWRCKFLSIKQVISTALRNRDGLKNTTQEVCVPCHVC
jgi:hypothetical protein